MDHPQFDHHEIYDQNGNGYNPDEYENGGYGYGSNEYNYNGTGYGGTQFLLDSKICYLFIGVILYTSCCFLRNRSRIRDRGNYSNLDVPINNSKIIEKIKKNIISIEDIDKSSSTCSICLDDFNSEKEIAFLDCKHIYHMECIIEWINKDASCPLCRSSELV